MSGRGSGARYWLGLGANLGDREASLRRAAALLGRQGLVVEAASRLWETSPRELLDQPAFLNAAVRVRAHRDPPAVLDAAKAVERAIGREPGPRYGPRAIDCDVLLWSGGAWHDARLTVPHPRLAERRFALLPLLDLDPGLAMPDGRRLADVVAALDAGDQAARALDGRGVEWAFGPSA